MDWNTFEHSITKYITVPCTVKYGCIGTGYLIVLTFNGREFVELGRLLYRCWSDQLVSEHLLEQFGLECERYNIGNRAEAPRLCFNETKTLTIN